MVTKLIPEINKVYFIIRKGKWDIPEYYGSGENHTMDIGYLMMNQPYGVPFTLNQAYPFVKDSLIAFGFPDIIFIYDVIQNHIISY